MSKPIYQQLHLDKEGYTQEKYSVIYDRLQGLNTFNKKTYYKVYMNLMFYLSEELRKRMDNYVSVFEQREEDNKELKDDKRIVVFFNSRVETELDADFSDDWYDRFELFEKEIEDMITEELILLELQTHTIASFIDLMLVMEDDHWIAKMCFTLYLLKQRGYEFEPERDDRVWQPKS